MIKTRKKAATKAGKRMMFGKEVIVKAKPAKTVVKAFPVAAFEAANLRPWFSRPWSCSPRLLVAPWGIGAQLVSRAQFAVH